MVTKIRKLTKEEALELIRQDFPSKWEFDQRSAILDTLEQELMVLEGGREKEDEE